MGSELGLTADSKDEIVVTKAGIWWICWATIWTMTLAAGMAFLIVKRNLPVVRVRGIGLSLSAVVLLHLYWVSVQLGSLLAPRYPSDFEYWIMGTYLPLGVGLFQAANLRFLDVAKKQREQFADRPRSSAHPLDREEGGKKVKGKAKLTASLWGKINALGYSHRVLVFVGIGMVVQVLLTVFMFCISRKYHNSWGIPGTEVHGTPMEKKVQMGRGWEWWPQVLWLFSWAWITAPYMLWKSRGIRDTQGWRIQTLGCSIAALHAAPMWLIALYVPAMEKINKYWIPPQWIAISIWVIEILSVFLPIWEIFKSQTLKKETLEAIAQWEAKRNRHSHQRARSMRSSGTAIESTKTGWKSHNDSLRSASGESVYTMSALEYVLEKNPEPLQRFSALKDFSGENIAFLTSVGEWRSSLPKEGTEMSDEMRRELVRERFNRALRIYTEFISSKDAEFQINLSSSQLKSLEAVFENAARALCGEKTRIDPATPFEVPAWDKAEPSDLSSVDTVTSEKGAPSSRTSQTTSDQAQYWGEIPDNYTEHVFDDAEQAIKYLVLTNTWPKFVRNRRNSMASFDVLAEEGQGTLPANVKEDKAAA